MNSQFDYENLKPAERLATSKNRFDNDACTVEYVKMTKEVVDTLLDGNIKNRKITDSHEDKLTMDFKNGRYVFTGQTVIRGDDGALLDGQHRLFGLRNAGYPEVYMLVVTLHGDTEKAYDRMDINKSRTYKQPLQHKGIDCAKEVAAIRKKITYIKRDFNSWPVVSDSIYDDIGQMYRYEIDAFAPLCKKYRGFTADMAAAACLISRCINGHETGDLEKLCEVIRRAAEGDMLMVGSPEHTIHKIFTKNLRASVNTQNLNSFKFATVANGLIAWLDKRPYAVIDKNSKKACDWIREMARDNGIPLLPKAMKDVI